MSGLSVYEFAPFAVANALALCTLLAAGAWPKVRYPHEMMQMLSGFRLGSALTRPWVLIGVGMVEGGVALAVLLPATRNAAAVIAAILFCLYAAAMSRVLLMGYIDTRCGCSGVNSRLRIAWPLVYRNLLLAAAALAVPALELLAVELSVVSVFTAFFMYGFGILGYKSAEQLIMNTQVSTV